MRDGEPRTVGVPEARFARRLARAFALLVALTFGLLVLGALVRAHGAGLACPDWPLCFGEWIPGMNLEVAFEWTHRVVAGGVSLVFAGLALVALSRGSTRRALSMHLALAFGLLACQVLLGALTVWKLLASWTVTAHLLTGNAFTVVLLWTTVRLRELAGAPRAEAPTAAGVRAAVTLVAGLVVLQLLTGGLVSSTYAGLACPEWPTCNGGEWVPSLRGAVGLHLAHRFGAYALLAALAAAAFTARGDRPLARLTRAGLAIGVCQAVVGVANVRWGIPVEVTGLHSALAAALVLTTSLALRSVWLRPSAAQAGELPGLARAG